MKPVRNFILFFLLPWLLLPSLFCLVRWGPPMVDRIMNEPCPYDDIHRHPGREIERHMAFRAAIEEGRAEDVARFLDAGEDINGWGCADKEEYSPINEAALIGHLDVVKLLVERGAHLESHAGGSGGALVEAARGGHLDVVRYLLDKGANRHFDCNSCSDPISAAAVNGHLEVLTYLLTGATAWEKNIALGRAADRAPTEAIRMILAAGADVNARGKFCDTPLIEAQYPAKDKHLSAETTKVLLEAGADVNARDSCGITAAMDAARYGNLESLKILVEAGADVNAKDNEGMTILRRVRTGRRDNTPEIIEYLISHGAVE